MKSLAVDKLWSFLQSLPMTESNERWLAERLLESANAKDAMNRKHVTGESNASDAWRSYQLSPKIVNMSIKNRKEVSVNIDDTLLIAMEEKYK